jgi:peptidyl-dipeptidase Dcp
MLARPSLAGLAAATLLVLSTVAIGDTVKSPAAALDNPLLAPWTGPFGGVPPFDRVRPEHLAPALEAAMAENLVEVDRVANNPAAPSFENTIAAMEGTGRTLDRAGTIYNIFVSNLNDEAVQAVEREMSPKLAAFSDQVTQNAKLYARISAVYEARETTGLTPEQKRLAWLY